MGVGGGGGRKKVIWKNEMGWKIDWKGIKGIVRIERIALQGEQTGKERLHWFERWTRNLGAMIT